MKIVSVVLAMSIVIGALCLATPGFGQSIFGTILGSVTDAELDRFYESLAAAKYERGLEPTYNESRFDCSQPMVYRVDEGFRRHGSLHRFAQYR